MRGRPIILLLLLVGTSIAAPDSGRQDPVFTDEPINDFAMAWQTGAFAAGTDDGSSDANPDASVWFIWDDDGKTIAQDGHAHPASCGGLFGVACAADAQLIALDADSTRVVVAATRADGDSELIFAERSLGTVSQATVAGTIVALDISDDGSRVVAAANLAGLQQQNGRLHRYTWTSGVTDLVTAIDETITTAAISADGASVVVGTTGSLYRFSYANPGSTVEDTTFPPSATASAFSETTNHLSITGTNQGRFLIHSDKSTSGGRELNARDQTVAITAVAFATDGTAIAVGNANGELWIYGFDPVIKRLLPSPGRATYGAAVTGLDFSKDGLYLAVSAGTTIQLLSAEDEWRATFTDVIPGSLGSVYASENGDWVLAGNASALTRFGRIDSISFSGHNQSMSALPGETASITLAVSNEGNRPRLVKGQASAADAGLQPVFAGLDLRLFPDDVANPTLSTSVAPYQLAGDYPIQVTVAGPNSESPIVQTAVLTVLPQQNWTISAGGNPVSVAAAAGESVEFNLLLQNEGNMQSAAPISVQSLTDGWTAILPNAVAAAPGTTSPFTVQFSAPNDAQELDVGEAQVTLANQSITLTATVDASFGVAIVADGAVAIEAGMAGNYSVTIQNLGNANDGFSLGLTGLPTGWVALIDGTNSPTIQGLAPGASKTVTVNVHVPATAARDTPHILTIHATSLGDTSQTADDLTIVTVIEPPVPEEEGSVPTPGVGLLPLLAGLVALGIRQSRAKRT